MERRVLLHHPVDLRAWLHVRPMVDELENGDARRDLGDATDVVGMEVRGDQMIDPRETCILGGCENAFGIAHGCGPTVAGVDEHRLAGR